MPCNECKICIESKLTNQRNKQITPKAKVHLEKVVTDLCGPISPPTINGEKYIVFFLDSATRYLEFKLLKSKSEAYEAFIEFKNRAENLSKSKRKIQYLKSDQGGEFVNKRFKGACFTYGIVQQFSAAYTHEQNGLIERINRTILEKVRCLLFTAKLPKYLWGEAVSTAVYLYNRTPHSQLQFKTPYQALYDTKPDITNIKVFRSIAYYKNKATGLKKLDPRAKKAILLGFGNNLYRLYDIDSKRLTWARDVKILENQFYNFNTSKETNLEVDEESLINLNQITDKQIIKQNQPVEQNRPVKQNRPIEQNRPVEQNQSVRQKQTRQNQYSELEDDDIDKLALLGTNQNKPRSYKEAIKSPDWPHWQTAMGAEIDQLEKQKTWNIVDLLPDRKALKT